MLVFAVRGLLLALFNLCLTFVVIQASTAQPSTSSSIKCPSNITIHSKGYFHIYLKLNESGAYGIFPPLLKNISKHCCGQQEVTVTFVKETSRLPIHNLLYDGRHDPSNDEKANSTLNFYFPVFTAKEDAVMVHKDFYFVELLRSPGPVLLMLTEEIEDAPDPSTVLIASWPLFLLLIIMAAVVGIIGWFLDHWQNNVQFPNNFYKGSWEGFWWAMVTMTTVGYGDKAPVSFAARILTVFWMICGTIVTSLFTANVATVLTTKNVAALQNPMGQKIGVLNSKHFFQREINEGATFIEYEDQDSFFKAFNNKKVSRLLVPNYLDHLYLTTIQKIQQKFLITNVISQTFSIGLGLVNDVKEDKQIQHFLGCWERSIMSNYEEMNINYSIIDPSKYHTTDDARSLLNQNSIQVFIFALIALLVIFFVVGSLWEYWKHKNYVKEKMETMTPKDIEMTRVSQGSF